MYILFSVVILVVSILLGLIVLVQNPKGGGLAANFSGGSQFMGVRQTADMLEKLTWGFGVGILILSLAAATIIPRQVNVNGQEDSELKNKIENTAAPVNLPTAPTQDNSKK
ncbi:MAG: preprotein translocase subunit SecG [Bacteroidetes bacterium]|nr:MAG: preprotein translocase subunit SecG [Bacteroidota bacterium]